MALRPRILITPSTFRISREGVNVQAPPSTTPEHLAMNSDWPHVERRHEIALVRNTFLPEPKTINLITPLPEPPLVVLLTRKVGTTTLRDTQSHESTYWQQVGLTTPPVYGKRTVQEDTHLIEWTSKSQIQISSKIRTRANATPPSQTLIDDTTKRDFIILIFKQAA